MLAPVGPAFHQQVWARLRAIDFGDRTTYGAIAAELGDPHLPARGRRRRRSQPDFHRRAVPPRRGQQRTAHRFRRRPRPQGVAAHSRGRRRACVVLRSPRCCEIAAAAWVPCAWVNAWQGHGGHRRTTRRGGRGRDLRAHRRPGAAAAVGWQRQPGEAAAGQRVHAVDDTFTMTLTKDGVERVNYVVEFEEGRRIAWRPSEPQPAARASVEQELRAGAAMRARWCGTPTTGPS